MATTVEIQPKGHCEGSDVPVRKGARSSLAAEGVDTPHGSRLASYARLVFLAGAIIAAFDVVLAGTLMPAMYSRVYGAVQLWSHMAILYWVYTLPVPFLLALLDRTWIGRHLPHPGVLLGQLGLALLGATAIGWVERSLAALPVEFGGELNVIRWGATATLAALLIALAGCLHPRIQHLARRVRRAGAWWAGELGTLSVVLAVSAWVLLCPVGEFIAASVVGVLAVVAMALAQRAVLRGAELGSRVAPVVLLPAAILGAAWPGANRDHARWVLFFRGGPHSVLAWSLRNRLDRDGDGAGPRWLGGADCDEGNPAVGPAVREVPGDGIDQDCRGGDAPKRPSAPVPPGTLPPDCRAPESPVSVLLLVVVDSLRGDYVTPELTPNLFNLARGSWAFSRAYSPTSRTASSMPSLLSGRKLSDMGTPNPVVSDAFNVRQTVTEAFRAHGYRTVVLHDLDFNPFTLRGFAGRNPHWRDPPIPNAKEVLTSATAARGYLDYLARSDHNSFALLHLADVHAPYERHLGELQAESESDRYALGVRYTDQQLGSLLVELQQSGELRRLVVAITADHGEELMERGLHGHPESVMEEAVNVPLIVQVPNCRPRLVTEPVSTTQLAPTLAAAAGLEYPGRGLFAHDGMPVVAEGASAATLSHHRAVVLDDMKLIVDVPNGGRVPFDLASDPGENENLYGLNASMTQRMEAAYQQWLDSPGWR